MTNLSAYPDLVIEWDNAKNTIDPFSNNLATDKKYWWKCEKGHLWNAVLQSRIKGSHCPYCQNKKILYGYNDLFTKIPQLSYEWDYNKNKDVDEKNIGVGSTVKVWWKCVHHSHSYESSPGSRVRGRSCPYCSNKKVLIGFNDLLTTQPGIVKEWDFDKNTILPQSITEGSSARAWWLCAKGHSYETEVFRRLSKRGCPICAGKKVIYETSVKSAPEMIELWDFEKNVVDPITVSQGSSRMFWWKDVHCGHSFQKTPKAINNGSKCPYCVKSNTQLLKGFNDLETKSPEIAKEWDLTKQTLIPSAVVCGSKKKAWWICEQKHEWKATIDQRYRKNTSCPQCSMKGTSKTEKDLQNFVVQISSGKFSVLTNNRTVISPKELDIYIPEKNIAIEFNGLYWHSEDAGKDKNYHYDKWKKCKDLGIQLITIWEDDWIQRRSIVESMLMHKLGVNTENKVYARKTVAKEIGNECAKSFLNSCHVQGFKTITKNYGLFDKVSDELVAVMSFTVSKNVASLDRYATVGSVVGGFSKLLNYYIVHNPAVESVVSFADNEVSDGGLYVNNGFVVDSYVKPDYKYIYRNARCHKFLFRKKRFEADPDLLFVDGLSERELAAVNDIPRVWDCGKTKFVKKIIR